MELYKKLNIDDVIFEDIKKRLKRMPNDFETYLFSAMHSEHCGYMHSKKYIKDFYTNNNLEDENSGCIQIKDYSVFFKIESHNHPCAIEPFQGSMTGIGGIVRDILSLGARPIILANSLKFGKIKEDKTKYYLQEVVRGISTYGNCIGVPTITGETIFSEKYSKNPVVNVLALGIVKTKDIKLSKAKEDCLVVLVGSKTGVDGLNGANFASNVLCEKQSSKRSVQIGDPYTKKKLIEATIKINLLDGVVACQDLGASGILSSTSEMAYKGNCSIELYLEKVHTQFPSITDEEIMLSESQERMAFIIKKEAISDFEKIVKEYELEFSVIGQTKKGHFYRVFRDGKLLADIDLKVLCEPYLYDLELSSKTKVQEEIDNKLSFLDKFNLMINDENFVSKKYIYQTFDAEVQGRTSFSSRENSIGVEYLKETNSFLGIAIETAIREKNESAKNLVSYSFLNLYRKLVSFGFNPKGLTNCLNYANPEKVDTQDDFLRSIYELKRLSHEYKIPVVSGNVSFYNEFKNFKIPPTNTFSMIGTLENEKELITPDVKEGYEIFLFGDNKYSDTCFENEDKLKEIIFELRDKNVIDTVRAIGKYGIIGTLTKDSLFYNIGYKLEEISFSDEIYFKKYLNAYILMTKDKEKFLKYFSEFSIPCLYLGKFIGDKIEFKNFSFDVKKYRDIYQNKIKNEME